MKTSANFSFPYDLLTIIFNSRYSFLQANPKAETSKENKYTEQLCWSRFAGPVTHSLILAITEEPCRFKEVKRKLQRLFSRSWVKGTWEGLSACRFSCLSHLSRVSYSKVEMIGFMQSPEKQGDKSVPCRASKVPKLYALKWMSVACSVLSDSCRSHGLLASHALLSVGFRRNKYQSGLPFPPLGSLPDSGIKPRSPVSPALAGRFFYQWATGKYLCS